MKNFLDNLYYSFFYGYKNHKSVYILSLSFIIIGIVIGCVISFSYGDTNFVLSLSDKNFVDFVNGTAELSQLFVGNFRWIIVGNLICVILSFCLVTFSLSLVYVSYQSALMAITIVEVIRNFRLTGVINSLLFILPFNLVIILCLVVLSSMLFVFFSENRKSKLKLFELKTDKYIFIKVLCVFLIEVIVCFLLSYFVPLTLKSLIIVNF